MTLSQSIIYGIVQGLTEFLPISSSAHLILLPFFTKWPDPGLAFDVALHWGTLIAVFIYFRNELIVLAKLAVESLRGNRTQQHALPWKIIAATIPGVLIGLAFEKQAEGLFRSPALLAGTLSIMGLALWAADRWGRKSIKLDEVPLSYAIIIGIGQGLAIVPGVSRSGITITTGLLLGLDRESAVKFSFLLSMPITLGAGLLKSKYLLHNINDITIWAGIISSAIFGLMAIHILLTYVKKKSFTPFVVYRLALAAFILFMLNI